MDVGKHASHSGLFIDLDGTLADSLWVMRTVYTKFLARYGKPASEAEFERLNGPPLADVVGDLQRTHAIQQPLPFLIESYGKLVEDAYVHVVPRAGAPDLLRIVRMRGIRVGVVTSNTSVLARDWLARSGLVEMVDVIVGGEEVRRGKPDPEPYLTALERTSCQAALSVAVEDSTTGARSAIAAGIPTLLLADSGAVAPSGIAAHIACLSEVVGFMQGQQERRT